LQRGAALLAERRRHARYCGLVYLRLGRFDAAIADYDVVLARYPKIPETLYGRGLAKRGKGDATGAAADIAAAKAVKPDIAEVFARFGVR
jgi:tetratricopeptide (TPR) repeat protein